MAENRFIVPLDVFFPRGNKLFGEAGQHGEAQMPPWPSVAAGAIRSRMLADAGVDFSAFAQGQKPAGDMGDALGTPDSPGSFAVAWFSLARRVGLNVEPVVPLPSDLVAPEDSEDLLYLHPKRLSERLRASYSTSQPALVHQVRGSKPESGLWLTGNGVDAYLRGQPLQKCHHTIVTSNLWKIDSRLGIALDPAKRSAQEGRLYTTEGVVPRDGIGFLVIVRGADGLIPRAGLIRLGGDGRGARITPCETNSMEPDWERVGRERRFRLVLVTPGIFLRGWRLPGLQEDDSTWHGPDALTARLISAAVARAQVVSGWDLAERKPKAALRAAPAGSVYWFDAPGGDGTALIRALRKLVAEGFDCVSTYPDKARVSEGFNNVLAANWAAASR